MKNPKAANMVDSSSSHSDSNNDSKSLDDLTSRMGGVSFKESATSTTTAVATHHYFSKFKEFDYNPEQTDFVNFGRLAVKHEWSVGGKQWKSEWDDCFRKSWGKMRKAKGFAASSIIEYYAVFAFDHYAADYIAFTETIETKWPVGSKPWRRRWLDVVKYPYAAHSDIIQEANVKIVAGRHKSGDQTKSDTKQASQSTTLPIRNPNQYFETHRSAAFAPDYAKSFSSDFANLALVKKWKIKSSQYKKEKQKAFDEEFNRWYENSDEKLSKEERLQILQQLCEDIEVEVGETITKCTKVTCCYRDLFLS